MLRDREPSINAVCREILANALEHLQSDLVGKLASSSQFHQQSRPVYMLRPDVQKLAVDACDLLEEAQQHHPKQGRVLHRLGRHSECVVDQSQAIDVLLSCLC